MRHKTLPIALSMLAHCNWLATWAETTGARRWDSVLISLQRTCGAAGPVAPHMPAAVYVDEDYMGRVKQVPSRPVVGASARPVGLSCQLTVAAVPVDLSCGQRSQRRQRALHRVTLPIRGVGIIFWW